MNTTNTAADNAPSSIEFERLLAVAASTPDPDHRIKFRFLLRGAGELGFRSGELLHFRPQWLNRERKVIEIPLHDDCVCPYCQRQARSAAENNDFTKQEALNNYWQPKYRASQRTVPYDRSEETIAVVEEFADRVGHYDCAQTTINRWLDRLVERAGVSEEIHPHALRAYAALWWARQGLEAPFLMGLLGWNDMRVAVRYVRLAGEQLQQRMNEVGGGPNDIGDGELITDLEGDSEHEIDAVLSQARDALGPTQHPRSQDDSPSLANPDAAESFQRPDTKQDTLRNFANG